MRNLAIFLAAAFPGPIPSSILDRELFVINNDTPSDTHDTLRCTRCLKDEIAEGDSDGEIDETK